MSAARVRSGSDHRWFSILRCPYCCGDFRFDEAARPLEGVAPFGVLQCACARFPVVDGIPIIQRTPVGMFEHTTGEPEVLGPPISDVVRLIENGQPLEALLECLAVPVMPSIAQRLPWRVTNHGSVQNLARWLGKRQLRKEVLAARETLGASEIFEFFYRPGHRLSAGIGQYFTLRFGQPRYLAALALLAHIPSGAKPVLDIACGAGHLEHYLTERVDAAAVVGTDMNFYQVWIARHWVAPAARFVCANARDGLPFASDAFSATVCSDAYHYIGNRPRLQEEIRRCASSRPVLLTRVGNRAVIPNEGRELTVREYLDEFGAANVRCFDEQDLVASYLKRTNALTCAARDASQLVESKWLSFMWNIDDAARSSSALTDSWPHVVGEIGLNPIYRLTAVRNGDLHLRFEFPLAWFAYENHQMLSYHPRAATITRNQLDRRAAWREDASLSALVESFVLIGLPRRFRASRPSI